MLACIGCNQGCIGHYHAGVPIGCLVNPRTGRERTLPARAGGAAPLRVAVVGAGPAGVAAALEAAAHGDAVTLVERDARHRRAAPPGRPRARPPRDVAALARERGRPPRRGRRSSCGCGTRPEPTTWRRPTSSCSPPARAPIGPPWADGDGAPALLDAWTAIANPAAVAGPVLVADWGGGWDGLDAAEVLAAHGLEVTLACAAPCPGETLHQYQRNLYLARCDERGIAIRHHTEVVAGPALRHLFSGRVGPLPEVATPRPGPGPRARRRSLGRAGGPPGAGPRGRRARPALGGGGDARGRARAAGGARGGGADPRRYTTASSPSRCATPAASVRERTSSLARMRETCTLAVFSAM